MHPATVMSLAYQGMRVTLLLGAPLLLTALFTGLLVSLFQAATQINEMTLSFIPKILGVFAVLVMLSLAVLVALFTGRRHARRLEALVGERTARLDELQREARAESFRMRTTLLSISDGVLATDGTGRIALANRAARDILGLGEESLEGRPLAELLPTLAEKDVFAGGPVVETTSSHGGVESILEATMAPLGVDATDGAGRVIALRDGKVTPEAAP
mgnify:CR=1 FL=1